MTDVNMNTSNKEDLFNCTDAGKNKLTPEKQTAESPAGRKVKQRGN